VVHQGAGRGGRDDVGPAACRRALQARPDGGRELHGARALGQRGRGPDGAASRRLGVTSFSAELREAAAPVWERHVAHPFVAGIGDGSLPEEKFRFYVRQDYLFLIDYGRLLALAAARAPRLEWMRRFSALAQSVLESEMDLHRQFAARW